MKKIINILTISLFLTCIKSNYSYATKPIVYTIAGSDSGGGAGIQADLHAIHSFSCHGCSAITSLTSQNSVGVTNIHTPPSSFLKSQLDALYNDLPPVAIKIGMLGSLDVTTTVADFLKILKGVFVVVDPVMISTSGHKLITDDVKEVMIRDVFPYADLITPNKYEAEELLGRKLDSFEDVEQGAKDLLKYGSKAVLIKGGHPPESPSTKEIINTYAQDYYLSSFSSSQGIWLRTKKYNTNNTHGTGCTLSSAIASAYALGQSARDNDGSGATKAIGTLDACVLGKAYVTAGIETAVQLGQGPGPVAHTQFPSTFQHFPSLITSPMKESKLSFIPMQSKRNKKSCSNKEVLLGSILPVVDSIEWVEKLSEIKGITDIQFRIKNISDQSQRIALLEQAASICSKQSIRLWINDYWEDALLIPNTIFGIHLGQEDLQACIEKNGLEQIHKANLALGLSTHSYSELAKSLNTDFIQRPSYISLGPIYNTKSKKVKFDAQGLETIRQWRALVEDDIPLVVIGGINSVENVRDVKEAGADCVALIGAIVGSDSPESVVDQFLNVMED